MRRNCTSNRVPTTALPAGLHSCQPDVDQFEYVLGRLAGYQNTSSLPNWCENLIHRPLCAIGEPKTVPLPFFHFKWAKSKHYAVAAAAARVAAGGSVDVDVRKSRRRNGHDNKNNNNNDVSNTHD